MFSDLVLVCYPSSIPFLFGASRLFQDGNKHLNPQFKKRPKVTEVLLSFPISRAPHSCHHHSRIVSFADFLSSLGSVQTFLRVSKCEYEIEIVLMDTYAGVEVQIMRGINHPSIVKLLQFFESDEHYFLILECVYICKLSV